MTTLGENLKLIRKTKKMTQKELAQKSGVKQSVISDLETGNAKSTGSILELASALGVTAEELKRGVLSDESRKDKSAKIEDDYYKNLPKLHKIVDKINDLKNKNSLTNDDLKTIDSTLEASAIALLGGLSKPSKKESEAQKTA